MQILTNPGIYDLMQRLIGASSGRKRFVEQYVSDKAPRKILDIGCGTAKILNYIPASVEYHGIDISGKYIRHAERVYSDRGRFKLCDILAEKPFQEPEYDLVLSLGVLHHLRDDGVVKLMAYAKSALLENGCFVSLDACITSGQSRIARFLINMDRGGFVRPYDDYEPLARRVFGTVKVSLRHDLFVVPYTHVIMECRP